MTEPIYAQRYRTKRHLPAGRAEAAYAGKDAEGHPVVVTVVRPVDADVFLRTMGVVASVRHLDLAPVVDVGRDGPDCYVVRWDYGDVDAAAMVERGPLAPADAALIGASAAAGLAALHERGVVHGGVDPASLARAEDGSVKLTGAGLAEAYPPPDLRPGTPPDMARYLSPEEVSGRAPSPASDVYRLGLVTYLLLTGRHVFDGADGSAVAQEQLDGVVQPPQLLNPAVPPALSQIVMRALDKDPGARGTAAQFQADIERVLRSAQVVEPIQKPRSRAWIWVVGLFVVLAAALAVAWALGAFDTGGGDVKVPDVTGMTTAKAGTTLTDAGFKTGKITQVQSTAGPEGTVVSQSPAAGEKAAKGSARRPRGGGQAHTHGDAGGGARRGRELAGGRGGAADAGRLHGGRRADAERFRACRQRDLPGPAGRGDRLAGQPGQHRGLQRAFDADPDPVDVGQSMS